MERIQEKGEGMRAFIAFLIIVLFLAGCEQQKIQEEKITEAKDEGIAEQPQQTQQEEISDDGLDEALDELDALGS